MSNTITLPQAIFKRLEKISTGTRRTPQSIIKQAIADRLEYEEWALEQIDAGLADINAGRVYSTLKPQFKPQRTQSTQRNCGSLPVTYGFPSVISVCSVAK
ncbi:MAG: hypothetical protein FD134_1562 [Gallionellaceae bacterium]|nr:MAG: hypothetical protein FD134_1562 [Gallionellaceae bacterium]